MTEDEIIEMGMQAGISKPVLLLGTNLKLLTAFAKLVSQKEYERGFIDGMQKQMQSSVDKAVNAMTRPTYHIPIKDQREWVGLTDEEIFEIHKQVDSMQYLTFGKAIEAKLKEKNT
jgi:hypothetical protein